MSISLLDPVIIKTCSQLIASGFELEEITEIMKSLTNDKNATHISNRLSLVRKAYGVINEATTKKISKIIKRAK